MQMTFILSFNIILLFFFLTYVPKQSLSCNTYSRIRRDFDIDNTEYSDEAVPDTFDAREKWADCKSIGRIMYHGGCLISWAVALTTVLTDRLCIMTKGEDQFQYSAEDLFACCNTCGIFPLRADCDGAATLLGAISHVQEYGLVSGGQWNDMDGGCKPISEATQNRIVPSCKDNCTNPDKNKTYSQERRYSKRRVKMLYMNVKQIQLELIKNGPLMMAMQISTQFTGGYTGGILQSVNITEIDEGHFVVRLIGWGEENGIPYWLVANAFGTVWGENGFFKIIRGQNFMNIEGNITAPFASVTKEEKAENKAFLRYTYSVYTHLFFILYTSFLVRVWA